MGSGGDLGVKIGIRREQRLPGKMCGEIVDDQLAHCCASLYGAAGGVRGQHDIVQCRECRGRMRFIPKNIEAGPGDLAVLQSGKERRFIE